ncbi:MAG: secretin N-terminal domain-containing protein [Phycisphaerales bacterium]
MEGNRLTIGGCALVIGWTSQAAIAQTTLPTPAPSNASTSLAGQIELGRLIDLASERLGLGVEYDPQQVKGAVTLRTPQAIPDQELWSVVNRVLASRGFTSVQLPGSAVLSVVRIEQAAALARIEPEESDGIAGFQTILITTSSISSRELADALRALLSKPGGQVAEMSGGAKGMPGAALLVSDLTPRLAQMKDLTARLDTGTPPVPIGEYKPTHLSAETLSALATQIASKQESASGAKYRGELVPSPSGESILIVASSPDPWLALLQRLDTREPATTVTYPLDRFSAEEVGELLSRTIDTGDDRWKLVPDPLTGSLVITATPSRHAEVVAFLERLKKVEDVATPMRAFEIKHRPVAEVLDTLNSLMDSGVLDTAPANDRDLVSNGASQRTPPPRSAAPASQERGDSAPRAPAAAPELRLTADEATNTLVAVGPPGRLSRLEELLRVLDVRQPQVMLDVMLVSMTDSDSLSFGVELERLGKLDNAATRLASLFGLSSPGTGGRTVPDSAGFTGAVLNPGEFSVVLKALESVNKGNSISNPKVLVTNNQQAVFSSTLQQPVQTQTRTGSNDTTFSYGGAESAGTTISVKPQIARADHLVLTYSIKLSSFVGSPTTAGLPPPKQENSVDSVATIPDGHTVVVGGLELVGDSDGESRVPLLGRIPVLGNLFKNRSISGSRTRFFVFIRPDILRHDGFEDLKYISRPAREAVHFDDNTPQVLPQVIR